MAQLMSQGWSQDGKEGGARPKSMPIEGGGAKPKSSKMANTMALMDTSKKRNGRKNGAKELEDGARFDARFKIVLLGDSGVGKTSLIQAAIGEAFNPTMISTIGIDFVSHNYIVDNYRIQLQIWDTAGQERYRSLAASSFRDAKAYVIVYDITNQLTFAKIRDEWLQLTDSISREPVPVFFVGNKSDLIRLKEVPTADAEKLCSQQNAHGFFETSALTGANVQSLFQAVAVAMVSTWSVPQLYYNMGPTLQPQNAFQLTDTQTSSEKKKKKKQCCSI